MKIRLLNILLLLVWLSSCNDSDYPGYSKTESGLNFKLHYLGDGERPAKKGEVILAQVVVKDKKDSIIYNTRWEHSGGFTNFSFNDSSAIDECFAKMHVGDSASFIINKGKLGVNEDKTIDFKDTIKLDIKIGNFFTVEEYNKWKYDMAWLYDREMNEQIALKKYLDSLGLDKKNYLAGIYFQNIEKGKGDRPLRGNTVVVHYRGYFLNGKEFDNTYGMNEPFVFNLGDPGQVLRGFEVGLQLMRKKGKAKFIIPSQLAFGEKGSSTGIIPPFTSLVYEVELINIL